MLTKKTLEELKKNIEVSEGEYAEGYLLDLVTAIEKMQGAIELFAGCKQHEFQSCPCHITAKSALLPEEEK